MLFYSFFKTLVGQQVTVQLKNNVSITGNLVSVDQFLNIKLDNIVLDDKTPQMVIYSINTLAGITQECLYPWIGRAICGAAGNTSGHCLAAGRFKTRGTATHHGFLILKRIKFINLCQ